MFVWKPLITHAMCFITNGNLVSGSFQSQQKFFKNTVKLKIETFCCFFVVVAFLVFLVQKGHKFWTRNARPERQSKSKELFKFALLLLMIWPSIVSTHSLAVLVVITQNVFLAKSMRSGNSNPWSHHHFVPQAFCSIEFLACVTFTCTEPLFSYPHKYFLTCTNLSHTKFNLPRMHNSAGSCTSPTNAGTHNPYGLICPALDSTWHKSINCFLVF